MSPTTEPQSQHPQAAEPSADPQPGDLAKGMRTPRNLTLKASGFNYRTSTGPGKMALGGHRQHMVCTRTQEKGE